MSKSVKTNLLELSKSLHDDADALLKKTGLIKNYPNMERCKLVVVMISI